MTVSVALFGHWTCPFSTRVEFALAQRGIDFEMVDVPPSAVRPKEFVVPQEFLDHSPRLEVPMVRVGDDYLADSIPVLEWLEERLDDEPLLPSEPADRALVRERVAWIDQNVFRPMVGVYYGIDPDRVARSSEKLAAALAEMAKWSTETGWLAGEGPTLAEAVLLPVYVRLDGLRALGFTHDLTPEVETHMQRCRSFRGWKRVEWTAEQLEEFVGRFNAYRRMQQRVQQ